MAARGGMSRAQRIIIFIIAIIMVVGTIGSFVVIIIGNNNAEQGRAELTKLEAQYQAKVDAQTKQLSDKYYAQFSAYQSQVAPFDKASVTSLQQQDLVVGTEGEPLTTNSSFPAYYIGWNPDGKVFDSSIDSTTTPPSLKAPLSVTPGGVIEGWTNGVVGMKAGGVRLLTIPTDQAYGSTGQGSDIPPNTPLKFIIMVIPTPETIQPSQELINLYQQYGSQ